MQIRKKDARSCLGHTASLLYKASFLSVGVVIASAVWQISSNMEKMEAREVTVDSASFQLIRTYQEETMQPCTKEMLNVWYAKCNNASLEYNWWQGWEPRCDGQTMCSASYFESTPLGSYFKEMEIPSDITTPLKWERSSVIDGDYIFIQFSRIGLYGGQYGPNTKHGSVVKINKNTLEVEAYNKNVDNRWAPIVARSTEGGVEKKHVYAVLSHYIHHAEVGAVTGGISTTLKDSTTTGRVGHWLFKLDYDTLEYLDMRETSVDLDLVDPPRSKVFRDTFDFSDPKKVSESYLNDIIGTTQLNGVIAYKTVESLCPGGTVLLVGVSGYPYYSGFSDEPQSRVYGSTSGRHVGKGMGYCSNDLSPVWENPAINGYADTPDNFGPNGDDAPYNTEYLGAGRKRMLRVGDGIPAKKFRSGEPYTVVVSDYDCSSSPGEVDVTQYLFTEYCFDLSLHPGAPSSFNSSLMYTFHRNDTTQVKVTYVNVSGTSYCFGLRDATFNDVLAGFTLNSTEPFTDGNKVRYDVAAVTQLKSVNLRMYYASKSTITSNCLKYNQVLDFEDFSLPVSSGRVDLTQISSVCNKTVFVGHDNCQQTEPQIPINPGLLKKKTYGDTIDTDSERVSIQNLGGSWWFRAASGVGVDGAHFYTPMGNGHMESVDRYYAFRQVYIERDAIIKEEQSLSGKNGLGSNNSDVVNASIQRIEYLNSRLTGDVLEKRIAAFKQLSDLDSSFMESAVGKFKWEDGSKVWFAPGASPDVWNLDLAVIELGYTHTVEEGQLRNDEMGYWSHLDIEANNVMPVSDSVVVFTTKGGLVGSLDTRTGDRRNQARTSATVPQASGINPGNFGGLCYPGGDLVVYRSRTQYSPFINPVTKEIIQADIGILIGFNFKTGNVDWVQVFGQSDAAHGVTCGNGYAFVQDGYPSGALYLVDVLNGEVRQYVDVPECTGTNYNCVEGLVLGSNMYIITPTRILQGKFELATTATSLVQKEEIEIPVVERILPACRSYPSVEEMSFDLSSTNIILYESDQSKVIRSAISVHHWFFEGGANIGGGHPAIDKDQYPQSFESWLLTPGGSHGTHSTIAQPRWSLVEPYIVGVTGDVTCDSVSIADLKSKLVPAPAPSPSPAA